MYLFSMQIATLGSSTLAYTITKLLHIIILGNKCPLKGFWICWLNTKCLYGGGLCRRHCIMDDQTLTFCTSSFYLEERKIYYHPIKCCIVFMKLLVSMSARICLFTLASYDMKNYYVIHIFYSSSETGGLNYHRQLQNTRCL